MPPTGIAPAPADILRLLADPAAPEGVLITLVGVEGSSSRAVGAQMAVLPDGRRLGSFSGGCIEAAVAAEALEVLADGACRTVRYGSGSPYLDIRLPCGGGIDLLFTPRPDRLAIDEVLAALDRREAATLALSSFTRTYHPPLRIAAYGQGDDLAAFVRLAGSFGAEVIAIGPDTAAPLTARDALPELTGDAWTAHVFLFHDRDWEETLLPFALGQPGFWHGAIGAPATQAARRAVLERAGVPADALARLRASVGLIPATRDPAMLALSLLADIAGAYDRLVRAAP